MKKSNYKYAASYGDDFEKELFTMLDNSSIPYSKEKTLSNSKRRSKDVGCDIECLMDDVGIFIEAKTMQDHQVLAYNNFNHPWQSKEQFKISPNHTHGLFVN